MLCGPLVWAGEPLPGSSYAGWQRHRDMMLKNSALARYYTFEDAASGAGEFRNMAGAEGALRPLAVPTNQDTTHVLAVPGRWPKKQAVRLDRQALVAAPCGFMSNAFTVTAWLRVCGPGSVRGDAVPSGGTLLSWGGGYWNGWRLTYRYPDKVLAFEIGRPKPSSAVSIHGGTVPDQVWHHLAAVWSGEEMRLYVNGLLVGATPFPGRLIPPPAGAPFKLGVAGHGWGSVVMEVDEVAVFTTALPSSAILREAFFFALGSPEAVARMEAGDLAMTRRHFAAAATEYAAAAGLCRAREPLAGAARLQEGQALVRQKQPSAAAAAFAAVLEHPALPEGLRSLALLPLTELIRQGVAGVSPAAYAALLDAGELSAPEQAETRLRLARALRAEGRLPAAREQYRQVVKLTNAPLRVRLEARLELGHAAFEGRDYAGARAEYAQLMDTPEVPAHYRSLAALRVAQSYAAQKNYPAARQAFERAQSNPAFPAHHRVEAHECARELERLQAGLPARDPSASRTRLPKRPPPAVEFYVAPDGRDDHPGTRSQPFATLRRARDAVRALRQRGGLPINGVVVTLLPGEYPVTETFRLTAEDSGTEQAPVVYRSESKGAARLHGGRRLHGFQPVTDEQILARLPAEARRRVLSLDLKTLGITDFGAMRQRGFGYAPSPVVELFCDGQAQTLARWPNQGFLRTGKVVDPGSRQPLRGPTFEYEGDRPARWGQAREAWLLGYWRYLWAEATLGLASVDPQHRRLTAAHYYGYGGGIQAGMPYYVFNLLEEIDTPGEWFLDRATGVLYFWPPHDPAQATVELSMLAGPMIQMDGVSHVTFDGLLLELGRAQGVVINGGTNCLLVGCTVRKLGGDAVTMDGGSRHGLLGCDLYHLGRGGVRVNGGDRRTLRPGGHFVENCHVYEFSRVDRTYTPAVWMDGVSNRIAHNAFHHSPGHAIRLEGNDHVVEFNDIHHVVLETDDQGALDMHYNPTYRGNIIRYNFWHDIGSGQVPCGQAGVRLDDAICGVLVYGNVFHRCSQGLFGGVQIHGGKENLVDNNLFVDCDYAVSFSPWGARRWQSFLEEAFRSGRAITNELYLARYPALVRLGDNADVNSIWRNVAVNCGGFLTRDRGMQDLMDNLVMNGDPGFVEAGRQNFALQPTSRVFAQCGFRPIPFDEIGLYESEHRASPARRAGGDE